MGCYVRSLVQRQIVNNLRSSNPSKASDIASNVFLEVDADAGRFDFSLSLKSDNYDVINAAEDLVKQNDSAFLPGTFRTSRSKPFVVYNIPRETVIKNVLESNLKGPIPPPLSCGTGPRNVVVEFSSPNMAKRFHVGHLRSTIIGNYIANLHSFLNDSVKKINYLGDWGTQVGYIMLGLELMNITDEGISKDPMGLLFKAYVHAHESEKEDPTIPTRARQIFKQLEMGDRAMLKRWKLFRQYTTKELRKTYQRLNINFDEYQWESMYKSDDIGEVIKKMQRLRLLQTDSEDRIVIPSKNGDVPIIKSDGTSLYATRDIAAAIDRYKKYKFDSMYYVVDKSQTNHFTNLFEILNKMKMPWANRLHHVKFGKIRGMSTRKGTAVFLSDFLDEAMSNMRAKQSATSTTKVSLAGRDVTSDNLGMAAIIIHDLKQRRERDYDFNWDVALDSKGETGVKLQYTHCRLASLEENSGATLPDECDPSVLREPVVNALIAKIVQFDEVILSSHQVLQPCHLTKYLFDLSHILNKTLKELRVKGEPSDVASQRLLLYHVGRKVLGKGMELLGVQPLNEM